jgi:hypothetical protein
MKKIIFAVVLSMFGVSAAHACDGMKGHEKADKGDQAGSQGQAKKDSKGSATKSDQKS